MRVNISSGLYRKLEKVAQREGKTVDAIANKIIVSQMLADLRKFSRSGKLRLRWTIARKDYDCEGCGSKIQKGEIISRIPFRSAPSCLGCGLKISGAPPKYLK